MTSSTPTSTTAAAQEYNAALLVKTTRDMVRAEADETEILTAWRSIETLLAYEDADLRMAQLIIAGRASARKGALKRVADDIVLAISAGIQYNRVWVDETIKTMLVDLERKKSTLERRYAELRHMPDAGDVFYMDGKLHTAHPDGDMARDRELKSVKDELATTKANIDKVAKELAWPWY